MPFSSPFASRSKTKESSRVVCTDNNREIEIELETREPTARYDAVSSSDYYNIEFNPDIDAPAIHNSTQFPIVVFLERGVLYNKQFLLPGEAVTMTKRETGIILPYRIHAVLGDESAFPTKTDSVKNLAKVSAIPVAFVGGCLVTAAAAGTLAGPSLALAPLVSGMVVKGVVIDAAAIAGGAFSANTAKKVAEIVVNENKEKLMAVTKYIQPGQRYFSVTGGLFDGPIEIERIPKHVFQRLEISATKKLKKRRKSKYIEEERMDADCRFDEMQSQMIE